MKLNLANLLTLFRIVAIPVVRRTVLQPARACAANRGAIFFGIAAITDLLDGWVARRYGQTSRFGEFLDPVADKLMVAIVLVMLVQDNPSWWVDIIAMIIIGREITISALREWMATIGRAGQRQGDHGRQGQDRAADGWSSVFMVYQNEFMRLDIYGIGFVLLLAAAVMTIWSMIVYLRAAWPYISLDSEP